MERRKGDQPRRFAGKHASDALAINDAGQVVGWSLIDNNGYATEWSNGTVINLGDLPGSTHSVANAINDAGQVVGRSDIFTATYAAEWSGKAVINLGPGEARGINDAGKVVAVGSAVYVVGPEPSTWAMMLLGFASLGFAAFHRCRRTAADIM